MEITIRDLHMKTGDWVRRAARATMPDGIVVLDRQQPIARIIPFNEVVRSTSFADRKLVKGFADLRRNDHDSTEYLSADRGRE